MRSASRTARKLTFLFGIFSFPPALYRAVSKLSAGGFLPFSRINCLGVPDFFYLRLPVRVVVPIDTLLSVGYAVNLGLMADETSMKISDPVKFMR